MNDTGTVIGNYRIISTIAYGSFGRVYLACHHVLTNRLVALKLMHAVPLTSEQEHSQFLQEAHILERLEHPYILPILDVGIHEGLPYIVSEYAPGHSLRKRLQDQGSQPLPFEEAQTILVQIGQALQYTHDQHMIHRDIKPENILFNAKGNALLADFGLATTLATTSVKYMTNAGTPRYMAPEQFQGQVSKESDQYALGCVAYEMFTGRPPFEAPDLIALMYKHVNEAPVPPTHYNPNLPAYIEQAVLKALMKQRSERHSGSLAFLAALQGLDSVKLLVLDVAPPSGASKQTETVINKVSNPTLQAYGEMTKVGSETFVRDVTTFTSTLPSQSEKVTVVLPVSLHDTENAIPISPDEGRVQPGNLPFIRHKFKPRSIWSMIAIACMVLVVILAGSLFWALQSSASSHGAKQETSTATTTASQLSTSTVAVTITPSPSATAQLAAKATPSYTKAGQIARSTPNAVSVSQPTPTAVPPTPTVVPPTPTPIAPTPTPTPKPLTAFSYYVCGDQVSLTSLNYWTTVQPGSVVHTSDYSGPVNSYTGPGGNPANSSGNCSGRYQWAWDQNPVQAMWIWSNAYLPSATCSVEVHIPSWYAGAPDAHYTLTINSNTSSASYVFDAQNQNQVATTWITLHIQNQVPSISMPNSTNNIYALTLTLTNGGASNWYLGADAIRFDCSARL